MAKTEAQRRANAAYAKRRQADGTRQVTFWLSADERCALEGLSPRTPVSTLIREAVRHFIAHPSLMERQD